MKHTQEDMIQRQALPLEAKIEMTYARVREWIHYYGRDGVFVSFSGGKDSTVLLDLVRNRYGFSDIKAMFVDVPTQYPELKQFVKTYDNVDIIKPKISFMEVCEKYGFPLISKEVSECVDYARKYYIQHEKKPEAITADYLNNYKGRGLEGVRRIARLLGYVDKHPHAPFSENLTKDQKSHFNCEKYRFFLDAPFALSNKCCDVMKKSPIHRYEKETGRVGMTAQMADESRLRLRQWMRNGCNGFEMKHPVSNPMSFWTENDVLEYIFKNKLPICSVYGDVIPLDPQLTFEDMGLDMEGAPRKKYTTTGCKRTGCMLCGFGCHLEKSPGRFELLKQTHPGVYGLLDKCKNNGVTFREAIEWTNEHGNLNIRL